MAMRKFWKTALGVLLAATAASAAATAEQQLARQILDATGVKGGLIAHLGCGDGRLTTALRAGDAYLVHGLDADAGNVEKARQHIRSLDLYGPVSVERWSGKALPYADNLVNLVVAEDLGGVPMAEVLRVLCPNGVAYMKDGGGWTKTVKPRPGDIDEWTHYLHGPDNNAVAKDTVVGPPRHLQWEGGPEWARSHDHLSSVSALVSAGGRIFYIVDEGSTASVALPPKWSLVARDAFNGVLLWKCPVDPWEGHLRSFRTGPAELARRLVAVGDRVYVTLGYGKPVAALDAATGQTVRTYAGTEHTIEILRCDGTLFLVVGDRLPDNTSGAAKPVNPTKVWHWWPIYEERPPRKHLVAVRADTGEVLWRKSDDDTAEMMPTTLAVAGGRAFFQGPREVIALEAASGRTVWRADRPVPRRRATWSAPTLVVHGDVVLSADRPADAAPRETPEPDGDARWVVNALGGDAPQGELIAFAADTGRKLWSGPCRECYNAPTDVLVADGLVWTGSLVSARDPGITAGIDVTTGQLQRQRSKDQDAFRIGMSHHRCYRNKATERYLVLGRDGIEFIDVATGKALAHPWVRGSCQYGVMPCNGLIYAPPHSCACHIESKLNGFVALAAGRQALPEDGQDSRLERGRAYGQVGAPPSATADPQSGSWPTFRHDPARSGRASAPVAVALKPGWQTAIGGTLSTMVAAEGKVFVAAIDAHAVHALDAATGKPAWRFTAGGRVDSPPTVHRGLVLFGSADGWVYCLRSADGELAWRFRAAPDNRRTVSYGQVESAWPVSGSVLVAEGVAYAAAGRSSFLDGGIYLYGLDPATGRKLSEARIDTRDADAAGALPDVLAYDAGSLFMRHRRFDKDLAEQGPTVAHLYSPAGFLDGTWWHRTYWQFGTAMRSGWGGWPVVGNRVAAGRLLVVDGQSVFGFGRLNQYHRDGSHVGLGRTRYQLFACDRQPKAARDAAAQPGSGAGKAAPKAKPAKAPAGAPEDASIECRWAQGIPLHVRAMVLADGTLFVAGPPDALGEAPRDSNDPYHVASQQALAEQDAAYAGRRGAMLWAVAAGDGSKLAEYKLESPPVFDGMIAANGRLYAATCDGRVWCMAPKD